MMGAGTGLGGGAMGGIHGQSVWGALQKQMSDNLISADLFMKPQQQDDMINESRGEASVAFDLPASRGRSRSKNQQSSVDTVTGEKRKRGRRSKSDSKTRQEQRLAKNRISAANSRKRRKKYIEQLEEKVIEAEKLSKDYIRLKTIVEQQKKQIQFQDPVYQGKSADTFFTERIDDFVKIEDMILSADENQEELDIQELIQIIQRLDV